MTKKLTKVAMTTALAAAAIVPAVVATPAQAAEAEVTFAKAYYSTANGTAAFEAGKLAGVISATTDTGITHLEASNGEVFTMQAFSAYLAVNPTATTDQVLTALSTAGKALSADQVKALDVKEGKVDGGKVTVDPTAVQKTALNEAIAKAEASPKAAELKDAIAAAKAVAAKADATQAEVDAAVKALNEAIAEAEAVKELKVESVSAINLKTTTVTFSEPVDPATINATNVKVYVKGSNTASVVSGAVTYTLSDDKKTLTITHVAGLDQQDSVKVTLKNVKSADDKVLADYEKTVAAIDVAAPTVEEIKVTAPNTIRVQFSEPLDQVPTFSLNNGNTAIVNTAFTQGNDYADLTIGITPENGSAHTLNVKDGKDYAGFKVVNVDKTFTYTADTVAPTATVEILSASKVKVKFDKAVKNVTDGNVSFYHTAKSAEYKLLKPSVSADNKEVTFDLKPGQVLPEGEVKILVAYTNENGTKIEDTFGNKFAETTLTATYTADTTAPTITNVAAHSTTELDVTFDEAVNNANVAANYTLKDSTGAVVNVSLAVQQVTSNVYRLTTAQLDGGSYTLAVKNVTDLSGNKLSDAAINVSIADKVAPTVTVTGEVITDKKVRVKFSEAMDKASIEDKANYGVDNKVLPAAVKITAAPDNKSVVLDFTDVTGADAKDFTAVASGGTTTIINVARVKDAAGNPTTALSTEVKVTHTPTLATVAPTKQEAVSTKQVKLYFDEVITNPKASDFVVTQGLAKTIGGLSNDIVDGKSVITLTLAEGNELAANTGASGATAATVSTAAANTVTAVNSAGSKVAISDATIADKIAPSIAKTGTPAVDNIVIKDTDTNGIVNAIEITFTENLKAGTVSIEDFVVDGYTVTDTSVTNDVVTLTIKEGTTANMTDTFTVKFVGDMSDINDNVLVANPSKEYKSKAVTAPTAPTAAGVAAGTADNTNAGKTTVNQVATNEYRVVSATGTEKQGWTVGTGAAVDTTTNVVAGDKVEVRVKATATAPASAVFTHTILAADITKPVTPVLSDVTIAKGATANKAGVNVVATLEYRVVDTTGTEKQSWTVGTGTAVDTTTDVVAGDKIEVRVKATATAPASDAYTHIVVDDNIGEGA